MKKNYRRWAAFAMVLAALVAAAGFAPKAALAADGYVAKIGDTNYATLNAAVAEVQDGETIELIADVTDATGITVPENSNFTIDFDGHTYTLTGPGAGSPGTEKQRLPAVAGIYVGVQEWHGQHCREPHQNPSHRSELRQCHV